MPHLLIPSKSGVHRAACLALYRALLRRTRSINSQNLQRSDYVERISNLCRQNARLQGHRDITTALQLGYRTLEILQNTTPTPENESRRLNTLDLLAQLEPRKRKSRPAPDASPPKAPTTATQNAPPPEKQQQQPLSPRQPRHLPHLPRSTILSRPYPRISGRRHIPVLVNACRVPFLRIKKPQPPALSRMIRQQIATRERRISMSKRLSAALLLAREEDDWDRILEREFAGLRKGGWKGEEEGSWTEPILTAREENKRLSERAVDRRMRVAERLTDIVEMERALAEEEKVARRRERRARAREGGGAEGSGEVNEGEKDVGGGMVG